MRSPDANILAKNTHSVTRRISKIAGTSAGTRGAGRAEGRANDAGPPLNPFVFNTRERVSRRAAVRCVVLPVSYMRGGATDVRAYIGNSSSVALGCLRIRSVSNRISAAGGWV